jgi:hypothetical protein
MMPGPNKGDGRFDLFGVEKCFPNAITFRGFHPGLFRLFPFGELAGGAIDPNPIATIGTPSTAGRFSLDCKGEFSFRDRGLRLRLEGQGERRRLKVEG